MVLGSVMLIESPIPGLRISWGVILPAAFGTAFFFAFAVGLSLRAQRRKPTTGVEGMIGEVGRVIEELHPEGRIKIRGEIWSARSSGASIPVEASVQVVGVENMVLIVKSRAESETSTKS
jgi:membrane-bound serine protease (ClpP class)